MANEVKLPALGENVPGGDVVEVKVAVGDSVTQGQELIEVEAEKSTVAVPSPAAGKITKVLVKKGDRVTTGQAIVVLESANGQPDKTDEAKTETPPPAEEPKPAAEETKKELRAAEAKEEGQPEPSPDTKPQEKPPADAKPQAKPAAETAGIVGAGPATRHLARDWGVDLVQVPGSGPKGRVTQEDVKGYVRSLANGSGPASRTPPLPDFEKWGAVEKKPFESIRKKTADAVTLAWTTIPQVTQQDLADVTDIEAFRKQQEGKGPKLTVTAFVLKACAIVLKQFPHFNASLDSAGGQVILKQYYHLGVAVDTERGLVVPVLRDVDKKSVHDIGKEMTEIAERARQRKLAVEDMQGATFTVSNLGGIGGTAFSPIVNWPQVAILGLSRSRLQPVWKDAQFVPRLTLPLSLSYDHRVIDGADAARFTRKLAELLENPLVMLLHA